jgi:hypothetical protein
MTEGKKMEILMGRRNRYSGGTIMSRGEPKETPDGWLTEMVWQNCFAFVYNDKWQATKWEHDYVTDKTYEEHCERLAKHYASELKRFELDYEIVNGVRIRSTTNQRVSCHEMPEDMVRTFRKYLDVELARSS